jgi:hypothetical protein
VKGRLVHHIQTEQDDFELAYLNDKAHITPPPFSVIGIITGNPMIIMILVMLIVVVGFPSLLQGMSPEDLAEMKKASSITPLPLCMLVWYICLCVYVYMCICVFNPPHTSVTHVYSGSSGSGDP